VIDVRPTFRMLAPSDRAHPRHTFGFLAACAACAAIDAVAAAMLLVDTSLPTTQEVAAAMVAHAAAVLLLLGPVRMPPSRRWLCAAAVLAVPCAGAAVAAASLVTRGRAPAAIGRRRRGRRRPTPSAVAIRRVAYALAPCDALDGGDEEQRHAALATLSRRRDPEAITLLRRAAASRDPDLALSAALVLDEIGERAERRAGRPDAEELRRGSP